MRASSTRVTTSGPRSLMTQAISAIRRNNGTLLMVPNDFGLTLGQEDSTGPWLNTWSTTFDTFTSTGPTGFTAGTAGAKTNVRIGVSCGRTLTPGLTYRISFVPTALTNVSVSFINSATNTLSGTGAGINVPVLTVGQRYTSTLTIGASAPTTHVLIGLDTTGAATFAISEFTCREVTSASVFIDSTGTQPVSAVGDVLGLLTDRSYGTSNLGPELLSNGDFSQGSTGWMVINADATHIATFSGGTLRYQSDTTSPILDVQQVSAIPANKWFQMTITVSAWVSGSVKIEGSGGFSLAVPSGVGTYRLIGFSNALSAFVIRRNSANVDLTIDSISVREVLGQHATQPTTANKPVIARVPRRTQGPINLLTFSSDFGNAAWDTGLFAYTRTVDLTAGPYGDTAWKLTGTATQSVPYRDQVATSSTVTFAAIHKAGTWSSLAWLVRNGTTATNLTFASTTTVDLPNGWVLRSMVVNSGITAGNTLRLYFGATGAVPEGQFWWLYRAALFEGSFTAQQIIDTGGIPVTTTLALPNNVLEWTNAISFDGSNDLLSTTILTGNEGWVCAGVTFGGAAAANETIFTSGAGDATQRGVWLLRNGGNTENTLRMGIGNGTALTMPFVNSLPLRGLARVVEGGWGASTVFAGVDGTIASQARTGDATSALANRIGAFSVSMHLMNGPMSALVYTPVLPSAADRALIRRWIGSLQGQTL